MDVQQQINPDDGQQDPAALLQEIGRLQEILQQREKLASVGQLTAGILHEIRNPLNFVINFSKISAQLTEELVETLEKLAEKLTADEKEELQDITRNLLRNLGKITDNGTHAMRITVAMLAQSRVNNNIVFEPADINQLVDEFAKLAYQGIRTQDNTFNLSFKTDYDASIGKVNIYAQDMGRAILNIVNNACYAMNEKRKSTDTGSYIPQLQLTTRKMDTDFCIQVRDNGTGMPPEVMEKIFNPFYTTKPGTEGTGLGLSMTHDIISKVHMGTLTVSAEPGSYTEFTIKIPANLTNTLTSKA